MERKLDKSFSKVKKTKYVHKEMLLRLKKDLLLQKNRIRIQNKIKCEIHD